MPVALESGYVIDGDPASLDADRAYDWLNSGLYWWPLGLDRAVFDQAVASSIPLSVLDPARELVGFGRIITDRATFAFLADVFIDPAHRGRGLGTAITRFAVEHPAVATCRRIMLVTRDAHEVYAQVGFKAPARPEMLMEIRRPEAGSPPRDA